MTPATDAADMREALVNRLIGSGHLHTPAVIDAFRTTERHQFLPGVDLKSAYKEDAVSIKVDEHGEMISCHFRTLDRRHPARTARCAAR